MKAIFLFASLLSFHAYAGTVYKCVDKNGTTTFSAQPCGQDAKEMNVATGHSNQQAKPPDAIQDISDESADNDCRRNARNASRYPSEDQLHSLERQRQDLEVQASYANNNLAGAVYENGVRKQMGDVEVAIAQERTRLTTERARIDQVYHDTIAECDKQKFAREDARTK